MIFVVPALAGDATLIEIPLRTGAVALLSATSTGKKIELTNSTSSVVNAAIETAGRYHAKNGSGKSFHSESEPSTQTGTGNIHCGIQRFIRNGSKHAWKPPICSNEDSRTARWMFQKSDIQRPRMLVNVLRLLERREAHASHGWDTSEA